MCLPIFSLLVGGFSVIVKTDRETDGSSAALVLCPSIVVLLQCTVRTWRHTSIMSGGSGYKGFYFNSKYYTFCLT